jgi:F-type H+-transporting ATPase subunit epsilon
MASTVAFKLISPARVLFEGQAELVIAVTTEGEEGILPSHAPFLAALKPGVLRANVVAAGGGTERLEFATSSGFMQALPDGVTILVDAAVRYDEIDRIEEQKALEAGEAQLGNTALDSPDYERVKAALEFNRAKLALRGIASVPAG